METIEMKNGFKVGFDELIQSVTRLNCLHIFYYFDDKSKPFY